MKYKYILILVLLISPLITQAAEISFSSPTAVSIGEEILVSLDVSSMAQVFNAVSGNIVIPKNFSISHIYDGSSVVTVWVERPSVNKEENTISFSGITPGGVKGDFKIISFVLKPMSSGSVVLKAENFSLLANDGKGTIIPVKHNSPTIIISKIVKEKVITQDDSFSPELFKPTISRTIDIFEGKNFISFSTNDKGVGLDHYEIASSFIFSPKKESYSITESPVVLSKTQLVKKIFIKAVDRNGNERLVYIAGPYYYYGIIGLILAVLLAFYLTRRLLK